MRALEIYAVTGATSCIACALEMRSSNVRERPEISSPKGMFWRNKRKIDFSRVSSDSRHSQKITLKTIGLGHFEDML